MKIIFVAESGIYEHWQKAFKKHTKSLSEAVGVKTAELPHARVDHADVIVYFGESTAFFHTQITLNLDMIHHATVMTCKGIKTLIVTKSGNPSERVYRVWTPCGASLIQKGRVEEKWYAFHTEEVQPAKIMTEDGFNFIDVAQFEKRFVLEWEQEA